MAIDVMRGLAAVAVLLCHIKHHSNDSRLNWRYILTIPLDFGELGVPLFIVISGFCIHLGVAKRMGRGEGIRSDWGMFWRRRVHRLYPPYLAAVGVGLMAYYLSTPEVLARYEKIPSPGWDLFAHLFMIQNLSPTYWAGAGNFPLWTLGMEEQLYALYFAYLMLRHRLSLTSVLFIVVAITVTWDLTMRYWFPEHIGRPPIELGQWERWPFGFWFNWILGAIAAEAYTGALRLPAWCYRGYLVLGSGFLGILFGPRILGRVGESRWLASRAGHGSLPFLLELGSILSPIPIALASFILLNRWVQRETEGRSHSWWSPKFAKVGLFSYSLYLTHIPVLHLAESITHFDDSPSSIVLRYVLFTPLCLVLALGFFHLIERRFLTYHPRRSPLATDRDPRPVASPEIGPPVLTLLESRPDSE